MLMHACGSRCAREGTSSEAEPARGRREPSSEADLVRGGREPSSEADLFEGGVRPRARRTCSRGCLAGPLWWATGVTAAWAALHVCALR
jgi:hypothetical protein